MKLGGFGRISDYEKIGIAGYDFAELDMPEIEALNEQDFARFLDTVEQREFPVLTGARILPVTEPLFFVDGFAPTDWRAYLSKTCQRAQTLGIRKVILGNGKARSWLSGEDRQKEEVFLGFLRMLADITGNHEQELILEPLGPNYSNYINTIAEAAEVIDRVGMPNLFTMADLRHMVWSQEPFANLITYVDKIHHVHVDYPTSYPERNYPSVEDDYDYSGFLKALKESQYNDTLTIEAAIPTDWVKAYQQAMEVLGDLAKSNLSF